MASQPDIVAQMITAMKAVDPDLDTSVGSIPRKIFDVVAEVVSEAYVDNQLLNYQYDIDSKTDSDLDAFVQLFGLARNPARRAIGTVTFSRTTGGEQHLIAIPLNAEIVCEDDQTITVQTLAVGIMDIGELSVTVPVQAINAGPDGNVAAGTLTILATPVEGIATVTNAAALTGGAVQETDDELRARWKATVFRSMAGTESMYLGVALNDVDCSAANVVGAAKKRREQVQVVSGEAESTVADAAYVYAGGVLVGPDLDAGDLYIQNLQYQWDTSVNPPKINILDATTVPDGTLLDLEFSYVPLSSRNDPDANLTNRVDIWCAGSRPVDATQSLVFTTSMPFSASTGSTYYNQNYVRPDGSVPTVGNYFIPLAWGPIVTLPDQLSIGGTVYGRADSPSQLGTTVSSVTYAYMIVHEDTAYGWSPRSRFGMEWHSGSVPAGTPPVEFSLDTGYTYNDVPLSIQQDTDNWRLAAIDALVHQAKTVSLKFNFAIIYDLGTDKATVDLAVQTALNTFLSTIGFDNVVQVSDVLQVVHNTPGVDAVRFLNSGDVTGWNSATPNNFTVGIQRLVGATVVESYVDTNGRPKDVILSDNQVPSLGALFTVARAQNSFASSV